MARYMEIAGQMHESIEAFLDEYVEASDKSEAMEHAAVSMAHIINLAVRACPRAVQSTVRKNIVAEAMKGRCRVGMTKGTDPETGLTFNKIVIEAVKRS